MGASAAGVALGGEGGAGGVAFSSPAAGLALALLGDACWSCGFFSVGREDGEALVGGAGLGGLEGTGAGAEAFSGEAGAGGGV